MRFSTSSNIQNQLLTDITEQSRQSAPKIGYTAQALSVGASYAPHGNTLRDSYTVPGGKRGVLINAESGVQRITAAGVLGLASCVFSLTLNGSGNILIARSMIYSNNVGEHVERIAQNTIALAAGDKVEVYTYDVSTGGTILHVANALIAVWDV